VPAKMRSDSAKPARVKRMSQVVTGADFEQRVQQTRDIAEILHQTYGPRPWRRHLPPVDELIATILSQHTSDINTDRAFASLKARFPTWPDVISAPTNDVVDAIRTGGLANQKAPRIQRVLSSIIDEYGSFDLDRLAVFSVPEARAHLTSIHGVGPKTASCVLLFSLGMPAMPVDTHVHRVTRRIGLIDDKLSADQAHGVLESLLQGDLDQTYAFHMHLIGHGRTVCTARRPFCERCTLASRCDYVQRH
jgi:endonuclease III